MTKKYVIEIYASNGDYWLWFDDDWQREVGLGGNFYSLKPKDLKMDSSTLVCLIQ